MSLLQDRSAKMPIVAIAAVALVLCAAGGAFTVLKMGKSGKGSAAKKVELSPWKLEEFVVNLNDGETRYLKVNIVLEVEGKLESGEGGNPDEAKARDAIIAVLTDKSYGELQSAEGKAALKEELKTKLNSVLEKTRVANIYFTSFAMQ